MSTAPEHYEYYASRRVFEGRRSCSTSHVTRFAEVMQLQPLLQTARDGASASAKPSRAERADPLKYSYCTCNTLN